MLRANLLNLLGACFGVERAYRIGTQQRERVGAGEVIPQVL